MSPENPEAPDTNQRVSPQPTTDTALRLAEALNETEAEPVQLIQRIVDVLGVQEAETLLSQTQETEASGGLMTLDGSRRRTPGGTFFWLTRKRLQQQGRRTELRRIFPPRPRVPKAPPAYEPPPLTERVRGRRKPPVNRPRRRIGSPDPLRALQRLHQGQIDQTALLTVLEAHIGEPPDLRKRSVDPKTGAVLLHFHFPQQAEQEYGAAIAQAAAEAGVEITIAPQVNQEALREAATAVLPADVQVHKVSIFQEQQRMTLRLSRPPDSPAAEASPDTLAAAQASFQQRTGWTLELVWQGLPPAPIGSPAAPADSAQQAAWLNQQQALDMVRKALAPDCLKVSVNTATRTMVVRFAFPDVAREQYASVLHELAERTGWQIALYPQVNQQALIQVVTDSCPPDTAIVGSPSLHAANRRAVLSYRGELSPEQQRQMQAHVAEVTGWQLELQAR